MSLYTDLMFLILFYFILFYFICFFYVEATMLESYDNGNYYISTLRVILILNIFVLKFKLLMLGDIFKVFNCSMNIKISKITLRTY